MNLILSFLIAFTANASFKEDCAWKLTAPHLAEKWHPLDARDWRGLDEPAAYAGLVTSQFQELDTQWVLGGEWPEGLRGTYLRAGPYGYDSLSGERKRSVIDSAGGMIREYTLDPANPRFRNRHIATDSYMEERDARRFLYPSIETIAPGRWNSLLRAKHQASVAVYPRGEDYWVTDEWQNPLAIFRASLDLRGEVSLGKGRALAHAKRDPRTGELCFLSMQPGRRTGVRAVCVNDKGAPTSAVDAVLPDLFKMRMPYFHDWALTENHVVLYLQPQFFTYGGLLKSLAGLGPLMEGLQFDKDAGAYLFLIPRDGSAPFLKRAPEALQVWHFVNAYEDGGRVVVDLAASPADSENVMGGETMRMVMTGQELPRGNPPSVFLYRYELVDGELSVRKIADDANYEFPQVAPSFAGRPYRYAYLARATDATPWHNGVAKYDYRGGRMLTYDFPAHQFSGEPIFAERLRGVHEDDGYLLVDVYDAVAKRSHLAIFDARDPSLGPIARLWLPVHMPFAFHGAWTPTKNQE